MIYLRNVTQSYVLIFTTCARKKFNLKSLTETNLTSLNGKSCYSHLNYNLACTEPPPELKTWIFMFINHETVEWSNKSETSPLRRKLGTFTANFHTQHAPAPFFQRWLNEKWNLKSDDRTRPPSGKDSLYTFLFHTTGPQTNQPRHVRIVSPLPLLVDETGLQIHGTGLVHWIPASPERREPYRLPNHRAWPRGPIKSVDKYQSTSFIRR